MYKDLESELMGQAEETVEEFSIETTEADVTPSLNERLFSWLESIDK